MSRHPTFAAFVKEFEGHTSEQILMTIGVTVTPDEMADLLADIHHLKLCSTAPLTDAVGQFVQLAFLLGLYIGKKEG